MKYSDIQKIWIQQSSSVYQNTRYQLHYDQGMYYFSILSIITVLVNVLKNINTKKFMLPHSI